MNETTPATTANNVIQKPHSGLAIASLACGVLGIALLGILTAIPAVICGHMSLGQLKREPDRYNQSSKGMAIAGLITGYLTIALTVLIVVIVIVVIMAAAAQQGR